MHSCFEYFACGQFDCVKHKAKSKNCWEIEGNNCKAHTEAMKWLREETGDKLEACKFCLYYQYRCEYEKKEVMLNDDPKKMQ